MYETISVVESHVTTTTEHYEVVYTPLDHEDFRVVAKPDNDSMPPVGDYAYPMISWFNGNDYSFSVTVSENSMEFPENVRDYIFRMHEFYSWDDFEKFIPRALNILFGIPAKTLDISGSMQSDWSEAIVFDPTGESSAADLENDEWKAYLCGESYVLAVYRKNDDGAWEEFGTAPYYGTVHSMNISDEYDAAHDYWAEWLTENEDALEGTEEGTED